MSTEQNFGIVDVLQLLVVDCHQAHLPEAVALLAVMHNVAQAIEPFLLCQLLLRLADGPRHAKAEARTLVNFYLHACKGTKKCWMLVAEG